MRNLLILQDTAFQCPALGDSAEKGGQIVAYASDSGRCDIVFLSNTGYIIPYSATDVSLQPSSSSPVINLNGPGSPLLEADADGDTGADERGDDSADATWFDVAAIAETGDLVCISHKGNIVSIKEYEIIELEGVIDGGIAAARWHPDQSFVVIVTNNNTIIAMTNTWEVLHEIPIEAKSPIGPCSLS
jgi:IKI3 family